MGVGGHDQAGRANWAEFRRLPIRALRCCCQSSQGWAREVANAAAEGDEGGLVACRLQQSLAWLAAESLKALLGRGLRVAAS